VVLLPTKVSISASPPAATLPCPSHASHRKHKGVDDRPHRIRRCPWYPQTVTPRTVCTPDSLDLQACLS